MSSFKGYLTEAQFSASTFDKVLAILEKRAKNILGQIYRYGGPDGHMELSLKGQKYDGYLYLLQNGRAFKLNVWRYKIMSINVWKEFYVGANPDLTIDTSELNSVNLLAVFDKIANVIKNPKAQDMSFYFLPESVEAGSMMIAEAKRIAPNDFYGLMKKALPSADLSNVLWTDIDSVARRNDVQVPSYVRVQRTGKGVFSVIPPGTDSAGNVTDVQAAGRASADPIPVVTVKMSTTDPSAKAFVDVGLIKQAGQLDADVQNILDSDPSEEEKIDATTLFGHLVDLVKFTASGANKSLFIYGGPGTGKTHTVTQTIEEQGLVKNTDWYHIKGRVTPIALYQTLFMHRKEKLLVFDDCDSVFSNGDAINILKGALDSYDERVISWLSARTVNVAKMDSDERRQFEQEVDDKIVNDPTDPKIKFPSEFTYTGRIMFISNLSRNDMDTAILSRSASIDMTLTAEQILSRIEANIDKLGGIAATKDQKLEVLQFFKERAAQGKITNPNMRMFISGVNLVMSGLPNWKDLLKYTT